MSSRKFSADEKAAIGERISRLASEAGLKPAHLAAACNVTRATASSWLTGKHPPGIQHKLNLERSLNASYDYMILGSSSVSKYSVVDTRVKTDEVEIVLIESGGESGGLRYIESSEITARMSASALNKRGIDPEHARAVKVSGDSMAPLYPDGSLVFIDLADTTIRDGKRYAIQYHGLLYVKILQQKSEGIRVISSNPDKSLYPDEFFGTDDDFTIIGKVFHRSTWDD